MSFSKHYLVFLALTAFAAFVGAHLVLRGKSDTAEIGSTYSVSVTEEIMDLIRCGEKIEAIKQYREKNPGTDLLGAKMSVEQIERQIERMRM